MPDSTHLKALLLIALALPIAACTRNLGLDAISVSPSSQSAAVGATVQYSATGTYGSANRTSSSPVTSGVTWTSGNTSVATIDANGLATAKTAGTTTITASAAGWNGTVTSTATLTVTGASGASGDVTSITVTPSTQTVSLPGDQAQFIAIGVTSSGATLNLTTSATWSSSSTAIGTINSTGLATAVAKGTTTIAALYTNSDQTVATGSATFLVSGGANTAMSALTMFPTTQSATALAQTNQFFVLATNSSNGEQFDVTASPSLTWSSTNTAVATVGTYGNGTPGLVTAAGQGSATIIAVYSNPDGSELEAQGSYSITVGAASEPLLSINIVPANTTVSNIGMTGQYLAFGTFSTTPTVRDLTDYVQWISVLPDVASINTNSTAGGQITATTGTTMPPGANNLYNKAGLATAQGYTGNSVIYAEATNPDGTVVLSNSQTFTCKDPTSNVCNQTTPQSQFVTITVFNAGPNETTWSITAPSGTGTANLIHCGPGWSGAGGSLCTGVYAYSPSQTITLTENPTGASFGGWSTGSNCAEFTTQNTIYSQTCTVQLNGNQTVGAIFYRAFLNSLSRAVLRGGFPFLSQSVVWDQS